MKREVKKLWNSALSLLTVLAMIIGMVQVPVKAQAAEEYGSYTINLAQGKEAYASSNQRGDGTIGERKVSYLTDGNTSTFIILHKDDTRPWVYTDLGAEYSVNKVDVYQGANDSYPDAYARAFTVEYSLDRNTWSTAATVSNAVSGKNTVTFRPVTARYIRIRVDAKHADYASFLELMVYETNFDAQPQPEAATIRLLFIGNSLTHYNDVAGKVRDLFAAIGQEAEVTTLIQLGKSLNYHATLPETKETILNGKYDYVIMQDKASNFDGDGLLTGVNTLNAWIKQAGSKPMLYMPWANKDVLKNTQAYFTSSYIAAAKAVGAKLAPAGEVWYELYYKNGYDWYSDNIHATNIGSCVSAATIFYTLTGRTTPLTFKAGDAVVTANNIDPELLNLIHSRACAYSTAYRDVNNIKPVGDAPVQEDNSESYTTNLAQGKNGYASSNQRGDGTIGMRQVNNLTDGSTTSYIVLHQDDTDPWVYTDLGKSYSVNKVEVYQGADNAYPNAYATSFAVQYTNDLAAGWKTITTVNNAAAGKNTVTFEPVKARYIRIRVNTKYAANASFLELMVYESKTPAANTDESPADTQPTTQQQPQQPGSNDTVRILFIGNSLTHYNDVAGKVKDLYAASGKKAEVQTLIQLGQPLTLHASLPETKETILNGNFDYVIMQDKASNFDGNGLMTGVQQINEWIKQAGAQPVLYMPWANESVLQNTQSYFTSSYVAAAKAIGAKLAPAGEVWYEMYYHYGYRWYSDNIHADNTGSCVSAATIYYTLTGETVPLQFTASDSVVTKNDVDAGVMNLIHMRACAYANAYRDLNNIQNAGAGTLPEKPVEAPFERPVITVTAPVNPYAPDADLTGINLALKKTAAASSGTAAAAVDGKTDSRWESAFKDNAYFYVDLGAEYKLDQIKIVWENAYGKEYSIETSTDGKTWTPVYAQTNGKGGTEVINLGDVSGRYVLFFAGKRATTYGYSFWEFEVYGRQIGQQGNTDPQPSDPEPSEPETDEEIPQPSNPSTEKPDNITSHIVNITASSEKKNDDGSVQKASYAADGNTGSRWESVHGKDGEWIAYEFDENYMFEGIDISWENASGKDYLIQVSRDGVNWTDVWRIRDGKSGELREIDFSYREPGVEYPDNVPLELVGKYLRIYGNSRNMDYGYSIWETKIYGFYYDIQDVPEQPSEPEEPEQPVEKPFPFKDVAKSAWYYSSVKEAYELGIMKGTTASAFDPTMDVTRGMFVTMLYKMDGQPAVSTKAGFKDVASNAYYAAAVNWAVAANVAKGDSKANTFMPNDAITREQFVKMVFGYAAYLGMDTSARVSLSKYPDGAGVSSYARESMQWGAAVGLVGANGSLMPGNNITRAEAAVILMRFYHLKEAAGK